MKSRKEMSDEEILDKHKFTEKASEFMDYLTSTVSESKENLDIIRNCSDYCNLQGKRCNYYFRRKIKTIKRKNKELQKMLNQ